jgi:hypothetical protein
MNRDTDNNDRPSTSAPRTILDDLESYWRDLRGARRLPVRTDVNPAQIDTALPHAFIIERMAPGIGRLRVAGQHLTNWLGMEARGMPLSIFFAPASRDLLAQQLDQVFDMPALVEMSLTSPRGLLRPAVTGRILILPLMATDGTVSRALGAIVTDGPANAAGRRFDITDSAIRVEPVDGMSRPRVVAETARRLSETSTAQRRAPLRLVVSNA